jgi:hypothetical protein
MRLASYILAEGIDVDRVELYFKKKVFGKLA